MHVQLQLCVRFFTVRMIYLIFLICLHHGALISGNLCASSIFFLKMIGNFLGCNGVSIFVSGTIAFLRSISLEAIGLGVHLAAGAHEILLQAEYILSSMQPSAQLPVQSKMKTNYKSNQPRNAQQGIHQVKEINMSL